MMTRKPTLVDKTENTGAKGPCKHYVYKVLVAWVSAAQDGIFSCK